MRRQTIDGKPIYSNELWGKMREVGDTLIHLGYEEASYKPNLFYKKIYKENGDYEILFADLRGDEITPIWKYLRVSLYPNFDWEKGYNCSSVNFGFQEILLRRNISIDIVSDFIYYDKYTEPKGFCLICKKDLLIGKDLSMSQESIDLDPNIELYFCDTCKIHEYEKIRRAKLCVYCKEEEWTVEHHISYEPELTIRVCNKCHTGKGGIHWWGFPNLLWKQRKKDYDDLKRRRKQKREAKKPLFLYICPECHEELYSKKKTHLCPTCGKRMKQYDQMNTNFHCVKCLRTWSGVEYNDYCPECMRDSENKLL